MCHLVKNSHRLSLDPVVRLDEQGQLKYIVLHWVLFQLVSVEEFVDIERVVVHTAGREH